MLVDRVGPQLDGAVRDAQKLIRNVDGRVGPLTDSAEKTAEEGVRENARHGASFPVQSTA